MRFSRRKQTACLSDRKERRRAEIQRAKELFDLQAYAGESLEHCGRGLVCPLCGSGAGANHSPAFSIKKGQTWWKCFSCGETGDSLKLVGILEGTDDWLEQLRFMAAHDGFELDEDELGVRSARPLTFAERAERERHKQAKAKEREARERQRVEEAAALARRVAVCQEAHRVAVAESRGKLDPGHLAYLLTRGIDQETAERWGLGTFEAPGHYPGSRLMVPYAGSDYYHIDRDVTGRAPNKYYKWPTGEVGPEPMWNPGALDHELIVVMEGQLDALAVGDLGYQAVATGGTGKTAFLGELDRRQWRGAVVLLGDSDEKGQTFVLDLAGELEGRDLAPLIFNRWPWDPGADRPRFKDPQEWWQHDRDGLRAALYLSAGEAFECWQGHNDNRKD